MNVVERREYDVPQLRIHSAGPVSGQAGGDGVLSRVTKYASPDPDRVMQYWHDYRNQTVFEGNIRPLNVKPAAGSSGQQWPPLLGHTYTNQGQVSSTSVHKMTRVFNLFALPSQVVERVTNKIDHRGRIFQRQITRAGVNTTWLERTWYNDAGDAICEFSDGSEVYTKTFVDGLGRDVIQYRALENPGGLITGQDRVLEQVRTEHDAGGNAHTQITHLRGPLNKSGLGVTGRIAVAVFAELWV